MTYPHGNLSHTQIRCTFFKVPDLAIAHALGMREFQAFCIRRRSARAIGRDIWMIAWPDGTTVEYTRTLLNEPLDPEDLAGMYRQFHELVGAMTPAGDCHES